jgi:hypothetical protein
MDSLARTGFRTHPDLPNFPVFQQGGLDCYCAAYATVNLIAYLKYVEQPKRFWDDNQLRAVLDQFDALHAELGVLGGAGTEGFQLLPAAGAAFANAGFKDARLSLRESIRATTPEKLQIDFRQSPRERRLPARIGITLKSDLNPEFGNALALAAIYECDPKPNGPWAVSEKDKFGHWLALVGSEQPSEDSGSLQFGGIVLDSSRNYGRWKFTEQLGLRLWRTENLSQKQPANRTESSAVKAWVYSLIVVTLKQTN